MAKKEGSNIIRTDETITTTETVDSVNAITLLAANPKRLYAKITLSSGLANEEAFIREYPATTDNIKQGELIIREISANHSLFKPMYETGVNGGPIYTGEISGIAFIGSFDLHIMEG